MKIIITTSDNYHHLLPVFFYLYNKYWGAPFDLVGHAKPECELPANCTWVSLGPQGAKTDFSTQLRTYFDQQPDWFVWMMEDTFLKAKVLDAGTVRKFKYTDEMNIGRIDLTNDLSKRPHFVSDDGLMLIAGGATRYRLSTQPSIWNKKFLLQYLTPGLSPWDFETQDPKNDGWDIYSCIDYPVKHNEGVRRFDTRKLNLDGMCQQDIDYIKTITDKW